MSLPVLWSASERVDAFSPRLMPLLPRAAECSSQSASLHRCHSGDRTARQR
jgi:hypothetical protein